MEHRPSPVGPAKSADPSLDDLSNIGNISYNRSSTTVNQTPSTPLLLDNNPGLLSVPDVPPPSYEEATGISPTTASPSSAAAAPPRPGLRPSAAPGRASSSALNVPGAFPRPTTSGADGRRAHSVSAGATTIPTYGQATAAKTRPSTNDGGRSSAAGPASQPFASAPAPGSVPRGRQFPPVFNLYGDKWSGIYTLGEHQESPLYAVRVKSTWAMTNPVVGLHNGPNASNSPLLAGVDFIPMSDHMSITLPPPLTYSGRGSTAVRLEIVLGWSHLYRFTMEVGTDRRNVHQETFEWRHSYGEAIAALGGQRDGWKLVRMSNSQLPGAPPPRPGPGFSTSDGHEVVAIYADARMSMTKQLKFAFTGTGRTGALGERWAVMAVTSALGIWTKEEAVQNRR